MCRHLFERDPHQEWRCIRCGVSLTAYQAGLAPQSTGEIDLYPYGGKIHFMDANGRSWERHAGAATICILCKLTVREYYTSKDGVTICDRHVVIRRGQQMPVKDLAASTSEGQP